MMRGPLSRFALIALLVLLSVGAGVQLNPRRNEPLRLNEGDGLFVLTT